MKQDSFSDMEYRCRKKKTKREEFLKIMDEIIPWDEWVSLIVPHYPTGERGWPPIEIEIMLRMYLLQCWFNLSDLHNDADAADVISETVLACFEKLNSLRQPQYFRTWLVRILIRKCQDMLRERKRSVPLDEIALVGQDEPGHARVEFLALLDSLDEKYRTVLLLYYGEGFSVREIAQTMDLKEDTVKTRLRRARADFKMAYEAE